MIAIAARLVVGIGPAIGPIARAMAPDAELRFRVGGWLPRGHARMSGLSSTLFI